MNINKKESGLLQPLDLSSTTEKKVIDRLIRINRLMRRHIQKKDCYNVRSEVSLAITIVWNELAYSSWSAPRFKTEWASERAS
jgi:hypothetical protein